MVVVIITITNHHHHVIKLFSLVNWRIAELCKEIMLFFVQMCGEVAAVALGQDSDFTNTAVVILRWWWWVTILVGRNTQKKSRACGAQMNTQKYDLWILVVVLVVAPKNFGGGSPPIHHPPPKKKTMTMVWRK